ncbi:MAG TPA: hypothetical protein VGZ00_10785 [Candidatus Baltobacteraceae bacterium]|jgi:N-dimethylarginine dimethylaminohydrolase|nr:hypothetical protein [Candidatus Baltobacteraceae bacterium]
MTRPSSDSSEEAVRQWERLVELLHCAGRCEIEFLASTKRHEAISTSRTALIHKKTAILGNGNPLLHQHSVSSATDWFAHRGYTIAPFNKMRFAGARDAIHDPCHPLLYLGYGWETEHAATVRVAEVTKTRPLALHLVDPSLRTLDTALCPLSSGHLLAYPNAFSRASQRRLRDRIPSERLIEIGSEDARNLACGLIGVYDALIVSEMSRSLRRRLHGLGYRIFSTDLWAFGAFRRAPRNFVLRLNDGLALKTAA